MTYSKPQFALAGLNERQREAAALREGPILVIAGPGSGKTRALTHRIAHLIAAGVPPASILALPFTNKAAEEMRDRIVALLSRNDQNGEGEVDENAPKQLHQVPPKAGRFTKRSGSPISSLNQSFIGTFHSFAAFILRHEAASAGFKPHFTIYDEGDRLALLKEVMKELNVSSERVPAAMVAGVLSALKDDLVSWEEYEGRDSTEFFPRAVARIYEAYQERLRFANALDFDDLIFFAVRLFRAHPRVLERWQDRFRFIHVDEYQDTNTSQYELLRLLAARHRNVFAIGDDAQSIYGWRRADYRNILNFERDWPEAKVIFLEENYRSTPEILQAANRLIAKNQNQKPKTLWTKNKPGTMPEVRAHEDERDEAEFVAAEIASLHDEGLPWSECAVLYRTNAQSRALEEAMLERDIPYAIIGAVRFFERREVKDLLAYLRFLQNPDDLLALKRIVNVPARGIGPKTFLAHLGGQSARLPPRDRAKLERFEKLIERLRTDMAGRSLAEFLRGLIKTIGYEAYLADSLRDAEARIENVRELVSVARTYDALPIGEAATKLLEDIALASEQDALKKNDDRVRMMTIHAAKGLEFRAVFIAGLEEGLLPHAKSASNGRAELEEERRLAYVGMTRAKERLYLTWALQRTLFGEVQVNMPSRFLRELPEEVLAKSGSVVDDEALIIDGDT